MIGRQLGAYRIDRELGSGGMGKVHATVITGRALGLTAGDRVALKVAHPHLLETEGCFMREAQLGAAIRRGVDGGQTMPREPRRQRTRATVKGTISPL